MKSIGVMVVVAALAGCFYSNQWGKTPAGRQKKFAGEISGAELVPSGTPVGAVHEYKVRFYADPAFRAHTPHWKGKIKERIARANQFLVPELGARLVVSDGDLREWEHRSDNRDLPEIARELRYHDPGEGVHWVIGLAAGSAAVTSDIHELGVAAYLSKHMVLRAMDDVAEAKAIEKTLDKLTDDEKFEVYRRRKAHKEMIVFLHEWGHTLGLTHVFDPDWIMNNGYHHMARAFSEYENRHMQLALAARRAQGADANKAYADLLKHFEAAASDAWDPNDRALVLRELRARAAGVSELEAIAALAAGEREAYLEAERLTAAEEYAAAWKKLERVAAAHADLAPAQLLACQLAAQAEVTGEGSRQACEAAAKLMPQNALPLILLAWARINDRAAAAGKDGGEQDRLRDVALSAADGALARLRAKDDVAARWVQLAGVYQALSAVSKAEEAVGRAPDANGAAAIQKWVAENRQWAAPQGVAIDDEPAYVETYWALYQALSPTNAKATLARIDAALKRHRDAPGLLSLRCAALVYLDKLDQAQKSCDKAIAGHADTIFARLTAAHIARRKKKPAAARAHLEHVITVDPDLDQAWTELAEVLEDDPAALGELKRRYRELRKKSWPY